MHVTRLDHINISGPAALIAECRRFYVDVIGLEDGDRPPFRSRGYWLYAGDAPVVHLTERDDVDAPQQPGPFAHYALLCTGIEDAIERLERHGLTFTTSEVPATDQVQLFLHDPAGVALELNFRRAGASGSTSASRAGDTDREASGGPVRPAALSEET